ncbi:Sll0543 protein [Sphingobacterium sp. JB170]|nr:Sll0543 protein [Sphingobacterium sp. JB170]
MLYGRYRYLWYLVGTGIATVLIAIYYKYNPAEYLFFPKCPVKELSALDCPGCGSQRAIHSLLHGDFRSAFEYNALLLPFMPYLALGFGFQLVKNPGRRQLFWRKVLYGEWAIKVVSVVVILYVIFRNL